MNRLDLEAYRHPGTGFTMPVPPGWERVEDPQDGVALIVVEPVGEVAFRANVVVTVESLPPEYDLEAWQEGAEELLPRQLPHYALIDRERIDIDGRDMIRRLAHYVTDNTGSVTMEQWSTVDGGKGYTVTASVATLSYDSLANLFADIAVRFRPGGAACDPEVSS